RGPCAPAAISTCHIDKPVVAPSVGDAKVVIVAFGVSVRRRSPARTGRTMMPFHLDTQVDEIVHQVVVFRSDRQPSTAMTADRFGFELPLLLAAAFRTLIDRLHDQLAPRGHPDARPIHAFALQAIGPDGATVSELGRRLGVSKQAAAKT